MPPSSMHDLFAFLTELMTQHAALFESMGQTMYRAFAIILIVWFGVKTALGSASGGSGRAFHFDQFAALLLNISFGFAMITFYSHPIPGIGVSFYHLIVDQALVLARQLDHGMVDEISDRLSNLYWGMESPLNIVLNILEVVRYGITAFCILFAQAAVFGVIAFGYVATAVAVMLGPIFIPFFIVPHMEWMFWGWLKALIQYAFYPVVGQAYLFVFGNLLIHLIDSHPPPYDGATLALLFGPLVMLLISFTYGILKIPQFVNSLFTGRSGESAVPNAL